MMSDNGNNDTPNDNENDDGANANNGEGAGEQKKSPGKEMREKLEATLAKNSELEGKLMLHEAGLTNLSERQRSAVLRDVREAGTELTVDSLKEAAKELGFKAAPKNESNNQNQDGQNQNPPANDGNEGNDDDTTEALNSMDAVDRALRQSRGNVDPSSFEAKLNAAKSQAEVEALIRTEGHKVGIVHEWDVE